MGNGGASDQLLWITEIGYPTGFQYWSEQMMADWLHDSFDVLRGMDGIGPIVWYNFRDKGTDPNDPEHHFGLVEQDFTPKLTYLAYRDYIAEAIEE